MKSITPNTSVSPAAIRNSSTPSCRPLSVWTIRRVRDIRPLHPSPRGRVAPRERSERGDGWGLLRSKSCPTPAAASRRPRSRYAGRDQSLHLTILRVRIGVVLEHLLGDLGLVLAIGALGHFHKVKVLDRVVVGVELERAAQRFEVSLGKCGTQRIFVVGLAPGGL